MKTRVLKICGLREPDNIRAVIELGPDWIGLIFYPRSPRFVSQAEGLSFLKEDSRNVKVMGVFVNANMEDIKHANEMVKLYGIQLHGDESPEYCESVQELGFQVYKAFGIDSKFGFKEVEAYEGVVDGFLFDNKNENRGGTGQQFDWNRLEDYQGKTPFLLSGGITPDTTHCPSHPQFLGVDLNSKFETSPGMKDIGLLQTFIKQYRYE